MPGTEALVTLHGEMDHDSAAEIELEASTVDEDSTLDTCPTDN